MLSQLLRDENDRYWFKSEFRLTDITDAYEFHVEEKGMWSWKTWNLIARFIVRPAYYRFPETKRGYQAPVVKEKIIGTYHERTKAVYGMDTLTTFRGMNFEIDLFDPPEPIEMQAPTLKPKASKVDQGDT